MKLKKGFIILSMSIIFALNIVPTFANDNKDSIINFEEITDNIDNRPYIIVNDTQIVYEGEDYENPITGEYIRWDNSRGIDKSFSFRVQYSITSSKFTLNGEKAVVTAYANVEDSKGNIVANSSGHLYTVDLIGFYSRSCQFSTGREQSQTIARLKNGGNYSVRIINNDYIGNNYLVGSGTIESI